MFTTWQKWCRITLMGTHYLLKATLSKYVIPVEQSQVHKKISQQSWNCLSSRFHRAIILFYQMSRIPYFTQEIWPPENPPGGVLFLLLEWLVILPNNPTSVMANILQLPRPMSHLSYPQCGGLTHLGKLPCLLRLITLECLQWTPPPHSYPGPSGPMPHI